MDYGYGAGLLIADERIRGIFRAWPADPPIALGRRLVEDLNPVLLLRHDIEEPG